MCLKNAMDVPKKLVIVPKEIALDHKEWYLHSSTTVIQEGQGATIGGSEETLLSAVWPYGMKVPPSEALEMSRSPHLTIDYLPRIKYGDLEFQVSWLR